MDLSLSDDERRFAQEARSWLATVLAEEGLPGTFRDLDAEIEWGRRWQAKLAEARWVGISWPARYGGRDATPVQVALFNMEYARSGAPQPVNRVGINLAGPTLLAHGTDSQRTRWLSSILDASEIWCQLFSEPDAGSDLASLRTLAERDGDGWRVSGQKVWTSYAQHARWGICLARTDPDAPRHSGISFLVVDMSAPGIEIRPLRQITGEAEFNEVFLDEVFVPVDALIGELHGGWAVAGTTLAHERGTSFPFKEQVVHEVFLEAIAGLVGDRFVEHAERDADELDGLDDRLASAYVALQVLRLHNWRTLSRLGRGVEPGPESSWVKLAWTDMTQQLSALGRDACGSASPLWQGAEGLPGDGQWQRQWLWSLAASIAGGTSEIQRTIIGERLLGLPRG